MDGGVPTQPCGTPWGYTVLTQRPLIGGVRREAAVQHNAHGPIRRRDRRVNGAEHATVCRGSDLPFSEPNRVVTGLLTTY